MPHNRLGHRKGGLGRETEAGGAGTPFPAGGMRFSGRDGARMLYGRTHEASAGRRRTGTNGREEERAGAESGGDGEQC